MASFVYADEDADDIIVMGVAEGRMEYEITRLVNYSLPRAGCEPNFELCELQCFACDETEESMCCTLPVVTVTGGNNRVLMKLHWSKDGEFLQLQELANISHNEDCVLAHVYIRPGGYPFVDCINTTASTATEDHAYIFFLELDYEPANIAETARFIQGTRFAQFFNFPGALSLSEPRYVRSSNDDCLSLHNIFFVANSRGYAVSYSFDDFSYNPGIYIVRLAMYVMDSRQETVVLNT